MRMAMCVYVAIFTIARFFVAAGIVNYRLASEEI